MHKRGITLLLTIIISFIVIALGLSISQITVRELDISATVRESMKATYAADSGIECAAYWALQGDVYFPESGTSEDIECGGNTVNVSSLGAGSHSFSFDTNGSKASAIVTRSTDIDGNELITLSSTGLSSVSGARIVEAFREYEIRQSNQGSGGGLKGDVFLSLDVSDSISGSRTGPPLACGSQGAGRIDCAIEAATAFIDALLEPGNDVLVGQNSFTQGLRCLPFPGLNPGTWCPDEDDEINDILLTSDESVFIGPGSPYIFEIKDYFIRKGHYRKWSNDGTNFHVAAEFARAELNGQEIIPRSESPNNFPEFRNLAGSGRDRNDGEFPDAYIVIGDFWVNAYYDSNWHRRLNEGDSRQTYRDTLKDISDDGTQIYLVWVKGNNSTIIGRARRFFRLLDCLDNNDNPVPDCDVVPHNRYEIDEYDELTQVLIEQLLVDLNRSLDVVPIIEK